MTINRFVFSRLGSNNKKCWIGTGVMLNSVMSLRFAQKAQVRVIHNTKVARKGSETFRSDLAPRQTYPCTHERCEYPEVRKQLCMMCTIREHMCVPPRVSITVLATHTPPSSPCVARSRNGLVSLLAFQNDPRDTSSLLTLYCNFIPDFPNCARAAGTLV